MHCKELSKRLCQFLPPTRSGSESQLLHIAPKTYLNAIMGLQGNTGNPYRFKRKAESQLEPLIKWNLNRKPVLLWGQSWNRLSFWMLRRWETRPCIVESGNPWLKKICLGQRELTRTSVSLAAAQVEGPPLIIAIEVCLSWVPGLELRSHS